MKRMIIITTLAITIPCLGGCASHFASVFFDPNTKKTRTETAQMCARQDARLKRQAELEASGQPVPRDLQQANNKLILCGDYGYDHPTDPDRLRGW